MSRDRSAEPRPEAPVALVTGASGGLGQALAIELDRLGCRVAVHYRHGESAAHRVADKLVEPNVVIGADLASWAEVSAMCGTVTAELGPVDVVVNNAAIRKDSLLATQDPDDWRQVLEINLLGCFHTLRATLPGMLRRRWGRVVNVVSPSGIIATSGQTAYGASKAGLIGLTRTLAAECGRRGVTVNALSPGFMETAMTDGLPESVKDSIRSKLPIPRFTSPVEVASCMAFFLDSGYVTGQVVSVDGGISVM